jgi:hypothetical protein
MPRAARRGTERENGRRRKTAVRSKASGAPSGSHMNMVSVAVGVGRNAVRPSWKTRGFG